MSLNSSCKYIQSQSMLLILGLLVCVILVNSITAYAQYTDLEATEIHDFESEKEPKEVSFEDEDTTDKDELISCNYHTFLGVLVVKTFIKRGNRFFNTYNITIVNPPPQKIS